MYPIKGFSTTITSGAVCKKNFGKTEHGAFAYVTLVRTESQGNGQGGSTEVKHYIKLRLRGKQAEYVNEYVNLGDSLIAQGDHVNERNVEGKVTDNVIRVSMIQSHSLPSRATYQRIVSAQQARDAANVPQQQAANTPQQQPPQAQPQTSNEPMDFDDDIPF